MFESSTSALLIRFLLFTGVAYAANPTCNCVVFRLDDIQDNYITGAQRAIIDVFKVEKIPMTAGIISYYFGNDQTQVNYIKDALRVPDWDFEIANHGYYHEYFDQYTLEQQRGLIGNALNKTLRLLDPLVTQISTFVPPMNVYNADTLTVLNEFGFKAMSSQYALDHTGKYPFKADGIYRWPIDSATSNMSYSTKFLPITAQQSMEKIQRQMLRDGFAAVMMHPQEFSVLNEANAPTKEVNTAQIEELKSLIAMVRAAGMKFTTFRNLPQEFGFSTGSESAPISTTGPISTGNGGSLTTGVKSLTTAGRPLTTQTKLTTAVRASTPVSTGAAPISSGGDSGGAPPVHTQTTSTTGQTTDSDCNPGMLGCSCGVDGQCGDGAVCDAQGICSSFNVEEGSAAGSISCSAILTLATFAVATLL
eukprot:TRINITY_DN2171_c0_g1_i2.p1 TRINITY_DN2171_c0_g1~~TRINITY_DN2171_c0_g1_i2.p1  ORF type:complete len:420 (-),score=70.39 TRINITY_DN2171_c0_g1_i2:32-1291(-)